MKRLFWSALAAFLLAGMACTAAAQEQTEEPGTPSIARSPADIVVRDNDPRVRKAAVIVNGSVITDLDVDQRLALVITASGGSIQPDELARLRPQIIRNLIDEKLQVQEAKAQDITIDDDQVSNTFNRVAGNFKRTPEDFATYLAKAGASRQTLFDQIRAELAWSRVLRRRVEPFVNVGDAEVDTVMQRLKASKGQDEFRLYEIFLAATAENEAEQTEALRNIRAQVEKGASFIAYARQYSESATAALGGDRGWVAGPQLDPKLKDAVAELQPGQIGGPIRVPGGVYLLLLNARRKTLEADPLDAQVTMKQISVPFPAGATREQLEALVKTLTVTSTQVTGCGRASELAKQAGGKAVDLAPQRIRDLPEGLHAQLQTLKIGQSTRVFGTSAEARVLMLCGRDEPQQAAAPNPDEIFAQMEEQRMGLAARRYLRDLRRDAVIDYR